MCVCVALPCIFEEVILQHPKQDGGQEARQQQHSHAAVDDGEPMDLRQQRSSSGPVKIKCLRNPANMHILCRFEDVQDVFHVQNGKERD